ncbi:putative ABC transport system permease protein [Marinimicrobium koreense]|uniref:Putative ABC transport system permease protein n=1 Tax=Marinimicrobium koreense TaxID=306545 RepID=A0A3N1NZJ6_9GAMM|nr:ABC transporter permease [Marinimicrobium koreense]ROQ18096.1 putative ABC transport system permease protein [Marinimicrobium koreense]
MLTQIARASLWNRRTTVALTLLALSIGVALLLGIDHLRHQAKDSFRQTLSGTDLIVGPRGGQTNLLLYSVFQMGQPSTSLSPDAYERLAHHPMVDWAVPIALGDAVQGFPVFATHWSYFERYRYGQDQPLVFAEGRPFAAHSDDQVVLGAAAARELGYGLGDSLVVAHGSAGVSFTHHDDHPMTVVGILEPTGTPADRRVHMTLLAMEGLHGGESSDAHDDHGHAEHGTAGHDDHDHGGHAHHDHHQQHSEAPDQSMEPVPGNINAVLLGLKSRPMVFALQRELNTTRNEPMTAILPGVALTELWQLLAVAENLLYLISFLVLLATLAGMMTMLLASMGERRRELAILRTVGASGLTLVLLIELEVALITLLSLVFGTLLLMAGLALAQPWLASEFGLFIAINPMSAQTAYLMLGILGLALVMGLVPALAAYRRALAAGLNPRQ